MTNLTIKRILKKSKETPSTKTVTNTEKKREKMSEPERKKEREGNRKANIWKKIQHY
jgi:hypothetical protein